MCGYLWLWFFAPSLSWWWGSVAVSLVLIGCLFAQYCAGDFQRSAHSSQPPTTTTLSLSLWLSPSVYLSAWHRLIFIIFSLNTWSAFHTVIAAWIAWAQVTMLELRWTVFLNILINCGEWLTWQGVCLPLMVSPVWQVSARGTHSVRVGQWLCAQVTLCFVVVVFIFDVHVFKSVRIWPFIFLRRAVLTLSACSCH